MLLELNNVNFSYNNKQILENINLELNSNQSIAILGPSGSGKTTLFNLFVGWLKPNTGDVLVNGTFNYLTQKNLLLKHLTVIDNIILPLKFNGTDYNEALSIGLKLLTEFGMKEYANYYLDQLSGGLLRRVSLLQVIMSNSDILLLDEPFSALDFLTRQQIYSWFLKLKQKFNLSICLITHDIDEAILLSDKIYILGKQPSTIIDEIIISFDQNRKLECLFDSKFIEYKSLILKHFQL